MSGRIYKIYRNPRIEYFYPSEYNDMAKTIDHTKTVDGAWNILVPGIGGGKTLDVYFTKGNTRGSSIAKEVLEYNGISPKKMTTPSQKRVRFTFKTKKDRENALSLINKMIKDKIIDASINYGTNPPTAKTKAGIEVELDGWSKSKANDPEYSKSSYYEEPEANEEENTSPLWTTWALIGGGVLLLLIIVAMFLKKK